MWLWWSGLCSALVVGGRIAGGVGSVWEGCGGGYKEVAIRRHYEVARPAVSSRIEPAHDRHRHSGRACPSRAPPRRRSRPRPRSTSTGARSRPGRARHAGRAARRRRPRRGRRRSSPGARAARTSRSRSTPTSRPVRSRSARRRRAAECVGVDGRSTSVPGSGAFEASTPLDAQTKPCPRLGDDERAAAAHDARSPREDHLDPARVALSGDLTRLAEGSTSSSRTTRPRLRDRLLRDDDDVAVLELGALGDRGAPGRLPRAARAAPGPERSSRSVTARRHADRRDPR